LSGRCSKEEAFERYVSRLRGMRVSVILFGSRARGDATAASDYDLLIVKEDRALSVAPHLLEPMLDATVVEVCLNELEERACESSLVLAAVLEGKLILDNLGIRRRLEELRSELVRRGASVDARGVRFPVGV
jgi:predicted nucleotidyltransferase